MTKFGEKLLNHSKVIIDAVDEAELEVHKAVSGEKGQLRIGIRCFFCYKWLPEIVKRFQDKFPNIDLYISNSFEPEKDLLSKNYDVTISTSSILNPKIGCTELFEDEFLCVMSSGHPFSKKRYMEISDFQGIDMIAMVEKSGPSFYNFFFKNKGVQIGRYMTITHPDAVVDMVEAGLGIAILPRWFILPYTRTKKINTCHLTSGKTRLQWKASYLKDPMVPVFQKEFINLITSYPIAEHI